LENSLNKRLVNRKIGFPDHLIVPFIIPVLAFILPFVFFDVRLTRPPYFSWNIYFTTLMITSANWAGSRYLLIRARTKYSHFDDTKRRLRVQGIWLLTYAVSVTNIIAVLVKSVCGLTFTDNHTVADHLIDANCAALFSTLTIVAIYETWYFMNELKHSVEEKEMLKRESLEAQLSALKTQVNPHFLFNNLNTLCAIIPDHPVQAVSFVKQLSKVYRHILEVKDEQYIDLSDELEVIKSYAFLLKTRFGNNLDIVIRVEDEKLHHKIVPLSLQLLMENAIKHNIISADHNLKVQIYAKNSNLVITNNLQRKNQIVESTSLGLKNIRNRYQLLTETPVMVYETMHDYTVWIPLIANE